MGFGIPILRAGSKEPALFVFSKNFIFKNIGAVFVSVILTFYLICSILYTVDTERNFRKKEWRKI